MFGRLCPQPKLKRRQVHVAEVGHDRVSACQMRWIASSGSSSPCSAGSRCARAKTLVQLS